MVMNTVVEKAASPPQTALPYVVLTGNPNCGKTTLFNALTGLRARVGNYAGVTVERKEGRLVGAPAQTPVAILDLPGTYSLSPQSLDEKIAGDVLFERLSEVPRPSLVIVVVDASNLQRNLYFATQVIELGYSTILALNMMDVAEVNGHHIKSEQLSAALGVPVVPLVASSGTGIQLLREKILASIQGSNKRTLPKKFCELPESFGRELNEVVTALHGLKRTSSAIAEVEALLLLSDDKYLTAHQSDYQDVLKRQIEVSRERLSQNEVDWRSVPIEARYARIAAIEAAVTDVEEVLTESFSDKLDGVLTHKIWGMSIFIGLMGLIFFSIFSLAQYPMDFLQMVVGNIGQAIANAMPPGDLNDLLVMGVVEGVGAVVVFLPQICLLFLFIGFLEDTGYMSRAAFLMDRLMSKVGLHGKSFIPMLSSFACAIPGIMATRTIETPKDRLVTILVAPLMSCSARLPVYTLLIATCFPGSKLVATAVMLSMYLLGIVMALLMALLFKKTLLKGKSPLLIMELPPYKMPGLKTVLRHMWERSRLFLRRAGTVILGINIILWFLATFPKSAKVESDFATRRAALEQTRAASDNSDDTVAADGLGGVTDRMLKELENQEAGEKLKNSFAGRMGRIIEPLIAPLGFDWKIGIGIISSFAAREVFVSTMSIVYNVGEGEDEESQTRTLAETLGQQKRSDGTLVYTRLTSVSLMVFYVLALQCISTVAVVRRETNSWKWPVFQWVYMGVLAWVLAFITYQGGKLLGFS